jgi:hypothetical protein
MPLYKSYTGPLHEGGLRGVYLICKRIEIYKADAIKARLGMQKRSVRKIFMRQNIFMATLTAIVLYSLWRGNHKSVDSFVRFILSVLRRFFKCFNLM